MLNPIKITWEPVTYGMGQWIGYMRINNLRRGAVQIDSIRIVLKIYTANLLTCSELNALTHELVQNPNMRDKLVELTCIEEGG